MSEDKDKRVKSHLLDTLRIMRVENAALKEELAQARKIASKWRDEADEYAALADPQWCGLRNEEPKTYAFPWEKADG